MVDKDVFDVVTKQTVHHTLFTKFQKLFKNYTYFWVKIRKIYSANEIHKFYVKTIPFLCKIFE